MPGFDVTLGDYTLVPNPFWGGALFPLIVLVVLAAFPWAERRLTGDRAYHNVLDRPRDAPGRTAFGLAGSADRVLVFLGLSYVSQIWVYRVAVWVIPLVVFLVVRRICRELQAAERIEHQQEETQSEGEAEAQPA